MFASRVTKPLALPSDPSVTVTIRKLSWLQRQDAKKQSSRASVATLKDMGPEMVAHFTAAEKLAVDAAKADATAAESVGDPLATHDMLTVLICGVKAWSVPEAVNRESLSDLDPEDAEFLARAILSLSITPAAVAEVEQKNVE